jgi:hypothetical protein
MNHILCDGGLCNRLNALVFGLILERRFGQAWRVSWPRNNWCDAPLPRLFSCRLPVDEHPVAHFRDGADRFLGALHENQLGFASERLVFHRDLRSYEDYGSLLERARSSGLDFVYYNNLLPSFVTDDEVREALAGLRVESRVAARASEFILQHRIDKNTVGLHIRKTDFGDAVDDNALYQQVCGSSRRFFVCSDDAEVNRRFAALPNCTVYDKAALPGKLDADGAWRHWITDTDGRRYPFNVTRSEDSVVDALVDLLVLSQTQPVVTSGSTFLATARLFGRIAYFSPQSRLHDTETESGSAVSQGELQGLLSCLRVHPLLDDILVRAGPQGDRGFSLPASAWRITAWLAVGGQQPAALCPAQPGRIPSPSLHTCITAALEGLPANGDTVLILGADSDDGAEWEVLAASDTERLGRVAVLAVTLRGLDALVGRPFFRRASVALQQLVRNHAVVHARAVDGDGRVLMGQRPFPRAVELTFVRRGDWLLGAGLSSPVFAGLG